MGSLTAYTTGELQCRSGKLPPNTLQLRRTCKRSSEGRKPSRCGASGGPPNPAAPLSAWFTNCSAEPTTATSGRCSSGSTSPPPSAGALPAAAGPLRAAPPLLLSALFALASAKMASVPSSDARGRPQHQD